MEQLDNMFGATRSALVRTSALVLAGIVATGCPARKEAPDLSIAGRLVIKGSNTFGEELAPRLIAEYRQLRPNVTIELESKGLESGFGAFLAGGCDL